MTRDTAREGSCRTLGSRLALPSGRSVLPLDPDDLVVGPLLDHYLVVGPAHVEGRPGAAT